MNKSPEPSPRNLLRRLPGWFYALPLSALTALAVLSPFFRMGSASGHDFEFHVASWLDVAYQWQHGILYPHWTAWTNFGFGEPRYIFYPPLSWMLGATLSLSLPAPWVPGAFIFVAQTLGGLAAFFLLRRLTGERAALFGAVFYAANPYALLISYVRSDFAEQLACAIFPLLFLAALKLSGLLLDHERQPHVSTIPLFAAPFAAVWLCNAPAGVIASYSTALLFAWAVLRQRNWKTAARAFSGLVLGFGLASFYILPAAYEQRWVNIGQALSNGLLPSQNFLFTQINDVEHTWFNWISSICALLLILLAALAALASRRFAGKDSSSPSSPWSAFLLLGTAGTLMMFRATLPLWNVLPELRFVQFPWRWMSILALVAATFLAAAAARRQRWLWLAGVLVLLLPLGAFLTQNTWWDPDEMSTQKLAITTATGYEGVDEYDPLGDDHLDLPRHAPLAAALAASDEEGGAPPPKATLQIEKWLPNRMKVRVQSAAPARVALRVLNYPAWRATVNGKGIVPERLDDYNQMVVPVAAGASEIEVAFARTPDRTAGLVVSSISLLVCVALLLRRKPQAG